MAEIRPFAGIRYASRADLDFSELIAPPYDVLDERQKRELQARHPNNIVTIDLPHTPPKSVGPDQAYQKAGTTLQAWLSAGVIVRDKRPAIYPYMQTFEHHGKALHRRGFVCLVKLEPLEIGHIVPHEKTYPGPIEDRLKLMLATGMQLSPVFGLFNDHRTEVTKLVYQNLGRPILDGTLDGVRNQLWSISDPQVHNELMRLMGTKPVYIADGHHRYTTSLQFQAEMIRQHGGQFPPHHLANYCMFVLVSMHDSGLLVFPTHRMIGGLDGFDMTIFKATVRHSFDVTEVSIAAQRVADLAESLRSDPPHTFGLYDGSTGKGYKLKLKDLDVLRGLEPARSEAWRRLDVAILQRYLFDEVLKPKFAAGRDLNVGYTADAGQIAEQVDGRTYQIALLLRPTPLAALEELGKHREVMPQKSTYFFPKLATGMVINPLR